ncbi:MAG: SagB/ThcOx family dehydrogenase [Hyphomicrobiales bacterium]
MPDLKVSDDIIIYFSGDIPYLIDTRINEEYEIDEPGLLAQLFRFIESGEIETEAKRKLRENNVLVSKERPALLKNFGNDFLDLFHRGCNDVLNHIQTLSAEEFADLYLDSCARLGGDGPPSRAKSLRKEHGTNIALPDPQLQFLQDSSLFHALDRRKTVREFHPHRAALADLSNLLFTCFGYFHQHKESENKDYAPFKRRSSPSGGCLQAIEAYICAFSVDRLENGVYWYDADDHSLLKVNDAIDYANLSAMLVSQFFGDNCAFGIFLTANLERFTWKYKTTRAYRVVSMEAGHFSQTTQLCGAAMGLNSWITGAFNDTKIEQTLNLDCERAIPLLFLAFGKGCYHHMNTLMRKRVETLKSNA